MKVYHSSSVVVSNPDTQHSRDFLDFGREFYVTTIERQAMNYGQRFIRRGREAWLNVYEMSEDFAGLKVLSFDAYDEAWLGLRGAQLSTLFPYRNCYSSMSYLS